MIHFVIGTEAELIKVFPVMLGLKNRKVGYSFISTGQHTLENSEILKIFKLKKPDTNLYDGPQFTSIIKLTIWFFKLLFKYRNKKIFSQGGIVLVHGDTVSSLLGAVLGRVHGLKVAHLESGLRSYSLIDPFPEEIIRRLVSKFSTIYFCPNQWACDNLKDNAKKIKVNLGQNTLFDSYQLITKYQKNKKNNSVSKLSNKYFIFILHRTETLYFILNKDIVKYLLKTLIKWSKYIPAVFVLHHTTEKKIKDYGFDEQLRNEKGITLLGRQSYPEFMKVLNEAEFIVTDGGSNQEECFYSGIPTLIIRRNTERIEGLGENVVLSHLDNRTIEDFFNNYKQYRRIPFKWSASPSEVVVEYIIPFAKTPIYE